MKTKIMVLLYLLINLPTNVWAETFNPTLAKTQPQSISYQASVVARERAKLSSEQSAQVVWIAPLGSKVEAGQVIAKQNDATYVLERKTTLFQIKLEQNKCDYLQRKVNRLNRLLENQALSEHQLDTATFELAQSQTQLNLLNGKLAELEHAIATMQLRAPFAGIVTRHLTKPGEMAMAGAEVAEIINPDSIEIEANIPAESIQKLASSHSVSVMNQTKTGSAELKAILPDIHPLTQTAKVHLQPNDKSLWMTGEHVNVVMPQNQYFSVNKNMLQSKQGDSWVTVLREQNPVRVEVDIIREEADQVIVSGKLSEEDQLTNLTFTTNSASKES